MGERMQTVANFALAERVTKTISCSSAVVLTCLFLRLKRRSTFHARDLRLAGQSGRKREVIWRMCRFHGFPQSREGVGKGVENQSASAAELVSWHLLKRQVLVPGPQSFQAPSPVFSNLQKAEHMKS